MTNEQPVRWAILVRGIVQGVGFRPFVKRLADQYGIDGFVQNVGDGVLIEGEGSSRTLDHFLNGVRLASPATATIEDIHLDVLEPRGERTFVFKDGAPRSAVRSFVSSDIATCDACLTELLNPADRRYEYPFLNCAHCGPRLTIIESVPYDRATTSMAAFSMCEECSAEFEDPHDRRFHAQPIACPQCGPRLQLLNAAGVGVHADRPLQAVASAIMQGQIVAIKGLGGFHIACDAGNEAAVNELRRRKHRDEQPLALMVRDLAVAEHLCEISARERDLLLSPERPIVLLKRRTGAGIAAAVGLGNPRLGVMLPYTPLHHLLLRSVHDRPLVMTSGNRSGEPIVFRDQAAVPALADVADLILTHDRPIHIRCDDSVTRHVAGAELPIRRSRGHVPRPLRLPVECRRQVLALGGQMKSTFALGRGRHAILSHHLGDLDYLEAYRSFEESIQHFQQLFQFQPQLVVHDLHPDYGSTHFAAEHDGDVERIAVQHHHAHMASCMADNGLDEPVIGVTFDGAGLGADGHVWGGEFLVGDYSSFRRAAHLREVPMPGGEQAIRQPWRMAAAHLRDARLDLDGRFPNVAEVQLHHVRKMLERGSAMPFTSSAGRLFDAVAALAGVRVVVSYEGQAAIELEWEAEASDPQPPYSFELLSSAVDSDANQRPYIVDTRPMIVDVVRDVGMRRSTQQIARRFHATMVEIVAAVCRRLRSDSGLDAVVLSGGVFLNALLIQGTLERLQVEGFRVYRHRHVPPNDGGLSLGQLAIAAAYDRFKDH